MKYTNALNIPKPVFDAVTKKDYSDGGADISVTTLIDSPRVRALERIYEKDLEQDAADLLAAFVGTQAHKAIEAATTTGIAERRLFVEVNGWRVSGGMDHYEDGILTDYKTTNVFKTVYSDKGHIESFDKQLNCYAHILRENNIAVKKLMVFAIFLDWRNNEYNKALRDGKLWIPNIKSGWPEKKFAFFEIEMWEPKDCKRYFESRVKLHQDAAKQLPLCQPDDLWNGNRCARYCSVNKWCTQYQEQAKTGLVKRKVEE